ncbi:MAG TPA: hypothetical protein VFA39_21060 [Steroidobacteraceae bacterium]|nr:hypothetical protein [Steroidobacteraceae bacterium]
MTGVPDRHLAGARGASLVTEYAIGDVPSLHHSLHRGPGSAKTFYGEYFAQIAVAAAMVIGVLVILSVILTTAVLFPLRAARDRQPPTRLRRVP